MPSGSFEHEIDGLGVVTVVGIYCLFSIANEYDQPSNNLVAWWANRPSIEQVGAAIGVDMQKDEDIAVAVAVWKMKGSVRYKAFDTYYRIEQVEEAK